MALLVRQVVKVRVIFTEHPFYHGQPYRLMVNGNAIGARRIDGAIQDGNFYTFVEVDDEELGQLVLDIKETIVN